MAQRITVFPQWTTALAPPLVTLGLSLLGLASPVRAEAPGVYYAWRSLAVSPIACATQARQALESQALQNIQTEGNSVSGQSANATAVFVCLEQDIDITTVMLFVSSPSDDDAFTLREALKDRF
ncbi:hypothetical protein [Leptolyngbya sp. PCC 6406]|uniref:hypothetical protein n=1 Tax=Leptolyngbya sp. PCC 6406 TaxID=1173264 RepID=UPI0002AC8B5E|nr:hypothetical protein [Leptolyngbya sp. PCC 6406]